MKKSVRTLYDVTEESSNIFQAVYYDHVKKIGLNFSDFKESFMVEEVRVEMTLEQAKALYTDLHEAIQDWVDHQ